MPRIYSSTSVTIFSCAACTFAEKIVARFWITRNTSRPTASPARLSRAMGRL
jgi:hypothetical protein